MDVMSREETLKFLNAHVKTEMLMKHLYAVEPVSTWDPGIFTQACRFVGRR